MSKFINENGKWLLFPCAGDPPRSCMGYDGMCSVPIGQQRDGRGQTWSWNGDIERPTVTPSINCGDCGWHGFIVNGEFSPPRQNDKG